MSGKLRIGIIGCGDFLRLRAADLLSSRQVEVKLLYSPVNSANAERYAEIFGAKAADSPEAIINDPEIDVVCVCLCRRLHGKNMFWRRRKPESRSLPQNRWLRTFQTHGK